MRRLHHITALSALTQTKQNIQTRKCCFPVSDRTEPHVHVLSALRPLLVKSLQTAKHLIIGGILFPALCFAEVPPPVLDAAPEPPDLPMPVQSGETLEPDITIIRRGKKTIHEYRLNGKLYKVKIIPDIGPAYYLEDEDGDGNLEVRQSDLEKGIKVQQWEIYSW